MDKKNMLNPDEILEERKQLTNGRLYQPSPVEHRQKKYEENRQARALAQASRMPFISYDTELIVYPGLVLVGGISGKGKSTLLSNMLAGFIDSIPDKKGLVITNEDLPSAVYDRTACILCKVPFYLYDKGKTTEVQNSRVKEKVQELLQRIEVVDNPQFDTTCLEDVQSVLEYAAKTSLGFVAIDYYQTITHSKINPSNSNYQVLKDLGFYLKKYARQVPEVPIIALVQLAGGEDLTFKERVEADKTVFNHAFQAIELETDEQVRQTKVKVIKDRYGNQQGKELVLTFEDGRYEVNFEL